MTTKYLIAILSQAAEVTALKKSIGINLPTFAKVLKLLFLAGLCCEFICLNPATVKQVAAVLALRGVDSTALGDPG